MRAAGASVVRGLDSRRRPVPVSLREELPTRIGARRLVEAGAYYRTCFEGGLTAARGLVRAAGEHDRR